MDTSVKSSDRAKIKGYVTKWTDAKYVLGCAFFGDLLGPCAVFGRVLQQDKLDILGGFTSLLRTVNEVNKLSSKSLDHWPTYSSVLKTLGDEDGKKYQLQELKGFSEAELFFLHIVKNYVLQ